MTTVIIDHAPTYTITVDDGGTRTVLVTETPAHQLLVSTMGVQGPPGPPGPEGPPGPSGAVQEQTFGFASPASVWNATHTLPLANPGVWAFDTGGGAIEGDVSFPTATSVRITWAWPMAGLLVLTT